MHSNGLAKTTYRTILQASAQVFGVPFTKQWDARLRFGRKLDLKHPTTLADKVSWIELHTDQTLESKLTDKYAVRAYIAEQGLEDILVPQVGGPWTNANQIDFDSLPCSFVIKATHGCGMNLIVEDKKQLDIPATRKLLNRWLHEDYPRACLETHYQSIPHRLYAEGKLNEAGSSSLTDYKIHCINGEPAFILRCADRTDHGVRLDLFDVNWNSLSSHLRHTHIFSDTPPCPPQLEQMLKISAQLAKRFPMVRVDLYEVNNHIYFSELTFTPAAGIFDHFDDSFIREWGSKLILPSATK